MAIRKFGAVPPEEHEARLRELGRTWFKEIREKDRNETAVAARRGDGGSDGGEGFSLFGFGDSDGGGDGGGGD